MLDATFEPTLARALLPHRPLAPQSLLAASGVGYVSICALMLAFGRPGLGLGYTFFVPVILAALATGPLVGAAAGVLAVVLYVVSLLLPAHAPLDGGHIVSVGIRFAIFVLAGATIGYFARRARGLIGEAAVALDELLILARRDLVTATRDGSGFERAVNRRLVHSWPFALLVGDVLGSRHPSGRRHDEKVRRVAETLAGGLGPEDELARIGPSGFAALVSCDTGSAARELSGQLERALDSAGHRATFGWAMYPQEGMDSLALFRAAAERLYARKAIRGEWQPTAVSAGLVYEMETQQPGADRNRLLTDR